MYNNRWTARRARCLERSPLNQVLPGVPVIECTVERRGKWSEHFLDTDLARIAELKPDILIRFGFGIIRGEILDLPRYGVWSFHHDDDNVVRGGPPAFWEIVDNEPVTGVVLQRLTDRLDGGFILHKGWFRTQTTSYTRNTDAAHLGAVEWPARLCRQILAGHEGAAHGVQSTSDAPIRRKPSSPQTVRFLARQGARWLRAQARAVTTADEWEIGVVDAPIHRFLDEDFRPEVRWLELGGARSHYAADPFLLRFDGADHVLYERFDQRRRTGEIWRGPVAGGDPSPAELPVGGHSSYPFVFEWGGDTFCLPQVEGDRARLYRRSVDGWEPGPLVGPDEPVLDPTLFRRGDRWWLLATMPGEWSLTHLRAWWADDLGGPWHPHLLNPVKSDVRSARPGGTPFEHEGRLFRPAQDGSTRVRRRPGHHRVDPARAGRLRRARRARHRARQRLALPAWHPHALGSR